MCVCSAPEQCAYTDGAKSYVVCSGGFTVTVSHALRVMGWGKEEEVRTEQQRWRWGRSRAGRGARGIIKGYHRACEGLLSFREGSRRWQGCMPCSGGAGHAVDAMQLCNRLLPLCKEIPCASTYAQLLGNEQLLLLRTRPHVFDLPPSCLSPPALMSLTSRPHVFDLPPSLPCPPASVLLPPCPRHPALLS